MLRPVHLAVRIQHHPSREALVPRLLTALAPLGDVAVVPDPEPEMAGKDAWRSHRACLDTMPRTASHLFVLQDDALPVETFHVKAMAAIERHPESVLLAFVPGFAREMRHMRQAQAAGADTLRFFVGAYVPTVAICYPRAVVDDLLDWSERPRSDRYRRPMRGADDGIVATYCRMRRIFPLALVPSIVEHDESLVSVGRGQRRGRHRRAALL